MGDNDIECPNCGASVYYELTRCPKCGWNFYDADANARFEAPPISAPRWLVPLKAILPGSLCSAAVAFAIHYGVSQFYSPITLPRPAGIILFCAGPLGALAGGYLAGVLAKQRPIANGIAVGIVTIGFSLLFESHWQQVNATFLLQPVTWLGWIAIALSGVGGSLLYMRLSAQATLPQWIVVPEAELYRDLLAKVRSDSQTAERLIAFERQKTPQASRRTLIQNAIERWLQDNR